MPSHFCFVLVLLLVAFSHLGHCGYLEKPLYSSAKSGIGSWIRKYLPAKTWVPKPKTTGTPTLMNKQQLDVAQRHLHRTFAQSMNRMRMNHEAMQMDTETGIAIKLRDAAKGSAQEFQKLAADPTLRDYLALQDRTLLQIRKKRESEQDGEAQKLAESRHMDALSPTRRKQMALLNDSPRPWDHAIVHTALPRLQLVQQASIKELDIDHGAQRLGKSLSHADSWVQRRQKEEVLQKHADHAAERQRVHRHGPSILTTHRQNQLQNIPDSKLPMELWSEEGLRWY